MNPMNPRPSAPGTSVPATSAPQSRRAHRHVIRRAVRRAGHLPVVGIVIFLATLVSYGVVSSQPSQAARLTAYITEHAQTLTVPATVAPTAVARDTFNATPGIATLVASGTNYDWAKLVLIDGGWEPSDNNVTVFLRWMRQENGADDWWNRNNPLNNGWGSGGGGGTGSYDSLTIAAENAAEALHSIPGYAPIVAAFAASASPDDTAQAIWWSPWSTSHYADGTHWSTAPVPVVKAPDGTW